jgi:hypothetical protein
MILGTKSGREVKITGRISDIVEGWSWDVAENYPEGARLTYMRDDELGGTVMKICKPPRLCHGDKLILRNIHRNPRVLTIS